MGMLTSKKRRSVRSGLMRRSARLQVEILEDRRCPAGLFFAISVAGTGTLNIAALASSGDTSLTISGDTGPGGGVTSMLTLQGGPGTLINGMNGMTFTGLAPGAIKAINVILLNSNDTLTVGTPTGIVNLPGTTLNVTEGSGNDTLLVGAFASGAVPAVSNTLGAVNWKPANPDSTGTESLRIVNTVLGSMNLQENSGPNDAIQLWGVTATGSVSLSQNHGAGDTISIDRLAPPLPPSVPPSPPNLVQNGGFETGDFTGWNLSGTAGSFVSTGSGGYAPHSGNSFAGLGHSGAPLGTVGQTLNTTVGTSYALSFWYASNGYSPNELKASLGGDTLFDQTNLANTNGYVEFSTTFTATSTSTPLVFGERDDVSFLALDDVTVTALPPSGGSLSVPPAGVSLNVVQGNGSNDNTSINHSPLQSISVKQGNGDGDQLFLGTGVTAPGGVSVWQGTGNADYLGVDNLQAGPTSFTQQDLATNVTGDTIGGVATNVAAPGTAAGFPGSGLDKPSDLVAANNLASAVLVPSNGLENAVLQQLMITQGSAPGDLIALEQLPSGTGVANTTLSVGGTLMIRQQDLAGQSRDLVFLGSYTPLTSGLFGVLPPVPFDPATATTGRVSALNEVVMQGDASGDVLSVLFNTLTAPAGVSRLTQGNGGDRLFLQEDATADGGLLNYTGGGGGNQVEADSNTAAGTIDAGANVVNNRLGQDYNNPFLAFVDFGKALPTLSIGAHISAAYAADPRSSAFVNAEGSGNALPLAFGATSPTAANGTSIEVSGSATASGVSNSLVVAEQYACVYHGVSGGQGTASLSNSLTYSVTPDVTSTLVFSWSGGGAWGDGPAYTVTLPGGQTFVIGSTTNVLGKLSLSLAPGQVYSITINGDASYHFPLPDFPGPPSGTLRTRVQGTFGFTLTSSTPS